MSDIGAGNGQYDPDDLDDDAPMDASEEAAAAQEATAAADESLDERVEAVVEDLAGVSRARDGEAVSFLAGGRAFAVLRGDALEVALDPVVAKAALKTANTVASRRGPGWIAFRPEPVDRFALDRAEAWVRSAHRRATGA